MTAATAERPRAAVGLAVEHAVDDLYQGVVPALVPLLVVFRAYDFTEAGGIVLAATLLSSIAQPLFGLLADRVAASWLRTAGFLTAATGIAAIGLTTSYAATCAAMLVSGLGVAAYHPEAARAVHATGTGDRGMGWFTFGGLAGYAAGPPAVALVVGLLGLEATPLLAVPAVVAAAVHAVRALRRRTRAATLPGSASAVTGPDPAAQDGRPLPAGGATDGRGTASNPGNGVGAAPRDDWRRFGWLTAVVMSRSVLFYGISTFLVVALLGRGASTTTATLALGLFTGAGAFVSLVTSRLTARLGRVPVLWGSYLVAAALLGLLLLVPSLPVAVVLAGFLGAALGLPVPVHTTLGQHYLPRHLGVASAMTLGLAVSTGGLASPGLGALADRQGVPAALAVLLVFPLVAAACTRGLRPR